ncbi:hypothetical protein [Chengkuizengella axinellae]|uniref:Uncharacterized protein n=1 Tax=Chengkuizengella axinellae TaxID=3064388 RepID=A0ABT9IYM7_9BACL|nr:hypothetical protein [Chengkuizengella sp. 2205SS18-9]MDP5274465.1 hypothetical protein [Chengkuizengella sp. 2205SS18-9]
MIIATVFSTLKPIKKSKGECVCCEDPMTNLLKSEIRKNFRIEFIGPPTFISLTTEILNVGEGIVVGFDRVSNFLDIFPTCAITRVTPITQQQINDPDRASRRITPPPAT